MAEDAGVIGYGATIGYGDTLDGSYSDLADVTDIVPPKIEVNKVDKTTHSSASYAREMHPGLITAGEATFKLLFDRANETTLYGLIRTTKYWRIQFPLETGETTASKYRCAGFICGIQPAVPIDDKMETEVTICWTGKPVFTSGS